MTVDYANLSYTDRLKLAWMLTKSNWKSLAILLTVGWLSVASITSLASIAASGLIGVRYGLLTAMLIAHYVFIPYAVGIFSLVLICLQNPYAPNFSAKDLLTIMVKPYMHYGDLFVLVNILICFLALTPQMATSFLSMIPEALHLPYLILVTLLCYLFIACLICCQAASSEKYETAMESLNATITLLLENKKAWVTSAATMLVLCTPSMMVMYNGFEATNVWSGRIEFLLAGLVLLLPATVFTLFLYAVTFYQSVALLPSNYDTY